jgi:hypothetical protein
MVVATLGDVNIVRVVRVVVVTTVIGISSIESLDSEGTDDVCFSNSEGVESVLGSEELGGDSHSDGEVAPKLVVGARARSGSSVNVFVNSSTTDQRSVDVVLGILRGIFWRWSSVREEVYKHRRKLKDAPLGT